MGDGTIHPVHSYPYWPPDQHPRTCTHTHAHGRTSARLPSMARAGLEALPPLCPTSFKPSTTSRGDVQDSLEDVCAGQRPDLLSAPELLARRGLHLPRCRGIVMTSPHSNTAKQEGTENRSAPEPRGGHVKGSLRYLRTEYSSVRAPRRLGASSSVPAQRGSTILVGSRLADSSSYASTPVTPQDLAQHRLWCCSKGLLRLALPTRGHDQRKLSLRP